MNSKTSKTKKSKKSEITPNKPKRVTRKPKDKQLAKSSKDVFVKLQNSFAEDIPLRHRVNILALAAVKGDKEIAKFFNLYEKNLNTWRRTITPHDYRIYNNTEITEEVALAKQYSLEDNVLNINSLLNFIKSDARGLINLKSADDLARARNLVRLRTGKLYQWFREETGDKHLVFYDTSMYEVRKIKGGPRFLHFKGEQSTLAPVMPINATSCYCMFAFNDNLEELDLSHFNTDDIVTMHGMFAFCKNLKIVNTCFIKTKSATDLTDMFRACKSLKELDLRSINAKSVKSLRGMFAGCTSLERIITTKNFNCKYVIDSYNMFYSCCSLPNYHKGVLVPSLMLKPVEDGGYLTVIDSHVEKEDCVYFV